MRITAALLFTALFFTACTRQRQNLFTKLPHGSTGINFRNLLKEDNPQFNIVLYPYFYNGGGVAAGDINNDGLTDLCFTGNMVKNRLYLNKGNMQFEDITPQSGIAEKEGWCTGVTMADINADGRLDIYICRSGLSNTAYRANLLFINNGDLSFTEKAHEYGLDDAGYSTQASFFDYDKDGDLDMVLANQSVPDYSKGKIEYLQLRSKPADSIYSNKLFRNDGPPVSPAQGGRKGGFTDVSKQAGISSNVLSFSLGVSTADINMDGWPDIYLANDFKEPDYLFINNKNGSFTNRLNSSIAHTSLYGMGIDVADYNNDALPDIVEMDMLPEGNHAQKMHMGTDGFDQYNPLFRGGMPYQYMQNCLQKNNGDGTFSEIAQLAGVSNTDWSWSPLLCDFDNDGLKDLLVTNGYKRDNTDIQFIKYSMDQAMHMQNGGQAVSAAEYISHMPAIKIPNYIFKNNGNDSFTNATAGWGLEEPSLSHGALYADLDNDGDMDLVINNTDDYAGMYRNNAAQQQQRQFLRIQLKGPQANSFGIGAKIFVTDSGRVFYQEQNPVRGYCSSVDAVLNIGLGSITNIDSVRIIWPDDKTQLLTNVPAGQTLTVKYTGATELYNYSATGVKPLLAAAVNEINFTHTENEFNDFTVQTLLPHYLSRSGPCMAAADVNADGREDVFIGGASGQAGRLFVQTGSGGWTLKPQPAFETDNMSEDAAALFFDADKDGDMDLYVGSGGYEFAVNDPALQDRLYLNNGLGVFTKAAEALPQMLTSTGCVTAGDVDNDGDMDLFIGGRCIPGKYPLTPESRVLINNGKGRFNNAAETVCSGLRNIGMVTCAAWLDVNKDGKTDLLLAGEWMAPEVFLNQGGSLKNASAQWLPFAARGWWNTLHTADLDGDGDQDVALGNQGLNNQFRAGEQQPISLLYKDFDGNGAIDPMLFYFNGGTSYPAYSRDDVVQQVPMLNKKYLYYGQYADATRETMFTAEQLNGPVELKAELLQTIWLENTGSRFIKHTLPPEAQYAPVFAIASADVNKDGHTDLVLAGNNTFTRIKFGRYDAGRAMLFTGNGKGGFMYVPQWQSGLHVTGNVRSMAVLGNQLYFGVNNEKTAGYIF